MPWFGNLGMVIKLIHTFQKRPVSSPETILARRVRFFDRKKKRLRKPRMFLA